MLVYNGKAAEVASGPPREVRAGSVPESVALNAMHDRGRTLARFPGGGLELMDSSERLAVRATFPDSPTDREAQHLAETNFYRGMSVEFRCLAERDEDGVRVVTAADLSGIGLVDEPAYSQTSLEVRRKQRRRRRWWM